MKRNFKLLVAVVVLATLVMTLASCDVINGIVDKINPKPHEHTYSADWSSDETNHWHAATCQDTEECGSQKSDVAPHTYADGKCSVCGAADPNYTPVCTEHAYGAPVETKAPTCTEKGEKTLTCTVCGETKTQEVAANGHTEVKLEGKAPTCTEAGLSNGKKCSVCDTILTAQETIPATNHNYVEGVCSACNAEDPDYNGPKTYVLDANDLENKAKIDEDGFHSSVVAGSKDFFTIYLSKKTEIKENKKTFEDGYVSVKRIGWNTKTVISEDEIASAIEMNITGTATVKIWWVSGGYYTVDDVEVPRQIAIYDENGKIVAQTNVADPGKTDSDTDGVKNNLFISELTVSKPGKYYLGNVGNSNYYFKVEVTVTPIEKHSTTVTTTDNNCWVDKVTFTATAEGEYTFYLPVNLGAWDAEGCDNFTTAPFVDPYDPREYDPEGEHTFTVGLEANETYEFYISAAEKKDWQIEWTYVACDVEDDAPAGDGEGGNENVVLDGVYTGHAMYQNNITVTFNPMLGVVTFAQGDNSLMCLFEVKDGAVVLYKNDGSGEEWNSMFYAITLENGAPVAATYNGNSFSLVAGAGGGDDDTDIDIGGTYTGTDAFDNAPLTVTVDSEAGTVEFVYNHPMMGPSTLTVDFAIVDGAVVLYGEDGSVLNPLAASLTLTDGELTEASYNGNSYTLAPGSADDDDDNDDGTEEIEPTVTLYPDEENMVNVTADDIEAGKIYATIMIWNTGDYSIYSGDLYPSKVMTTDGTVLETNDDGYYTLEEMTSYIIELAVYAYAPGEYAVNVEYQYPQGDQNNPEWLYVFESPFEFTASATVPTYWYTFYAPVTGKVTITSDSETALLLLTASFGYEVEGTGSVSMDVMKGRQYYFGVVDFDATDAYEVKLSLAYTEGTITTDGSKNLPHAIVIGDNTAAVEEWSYEYFAYTATEAGTLTLSTTSTNYAWAGHADMNKIGMGASQDLVIHVEMEETVYIAIETPDGAAASIEFTASFKADPKNSWFDSEVVTDGSKPNAVTLSENGYVSLSFYGKGQYTISWDNADAIVEQVVWMEGNTTLTNGCTVEMGMMGVDLKIYLPNYAAGTVNITITPVAASAE